MSTANYKHQAGFSLLELLIAMSTMIVLTGAAFALIHGSLKFTTATFHMTDAQQGLRTAQEFINRDLTTAGDGLKGIGTIPVPAAFVTNYLSLSPVNCPSASTYVCMAIVTSDNSVPGTTPVPQSSPAVTVMDKSDRLTLLTQDSGFQPVSLPGGRITIVGSNTNIVVLPTEINRFRVGEIYAIVTQNSAAFGIITSINTGTNTLTMANGDVYGLNQTGGTAPINVVSQAGAIATSIVRIQIIHYFVNSNKLLVRRTFGVPNATFVDSVIAEHVMDAQYRYLTNLTDPNGFVPQPARQLTTSQQQLAVREVETTLTTETVRAVNPTNGPNGGRQTLSTTTSTSVRNMQFRQALSP